MGLLSVREPTDPDPIPAELQNLPKQRNPGSLIFLALPGAYVQGIELLQAAVARVPANAGKPVETVVVKYDQLSVR